MSNQCDCPGCFKVGPGSYPENYYHKASKFKSSLDEHLINIEEKKLAKIREIFPKGFKIVKGN